MENVWMFANSTAGFVGIKISENLTKADVKELTLHYFENLSLEDLHSGTKYYKRNISREIGLA